MKKIFILCLGFFLFTSISFLNAQEISPEKMAQEKLNMFYSKLDLSKKQKEDILPILISYEQKVQALTSSKNLNGKNPDNARKGFEKERDEKIESILKDSQLKTFKKITQAGPQ